MLRIRILTTIIALPAMIYGILYLPQIYFEVLALLLFMMAIWEAMKLFLPSEGLFEKGTYVVLTIIVCLLTYTSYTLIDIYVFIFVYFAYFLFRNLALHRQGSMIGRKTLKRNFNNMAVILFFAVYIAVPFALCVKIRTGYEPSWMIILMCFAWGGDTGGYFAGRFLKKYIPYRLFPIVSPNKTWIGACGSILTALGMVYLGDFLLEMNIPWYHILAISIIGNALAQIGDLFESFIKRVYKVKDSGRIIPGHGGVLDRFDGFFFATPFMYWYLEKIFIS